MSRNPDFPPDTKNDEVLPNPLDNSVVDVTAAEPTKRRGRSKRIKPVASAEPAESTEPNSDNIDVGDQPEVTTGDTGDATATEPTVVGKAVPVEKTFSPTPDAVMPVDDEKSVTKEDNIGIEKLHQEIEKDWEKAIADGKVALARGENITGRYVQSKDYYIAQRARGLFDEKWKTEDARFKQLKEMEASFWLNKVKSPLSGKTLSKKDFDKEVEEKMLAKKDEIEKQVKEDLEKEWEGFHQRFILQRTEEKLAERAKAEEKVKRADESAKKIEEAKKVSEKTLKEMEGVVLTAEQKMEFLEKLWNKWKKSEKINSVFLPKNKNFGKKIKTAEETLDPKIPAEKEILKNKLQENTADMIKIAEILSGENLREGAKGKRGRAYREHLTKQVERIFEEQVKKIEDETGKHINFTKKEKVKADNPAETLASPPAVESSPKQKENLADKEVDPFALSGDYDDGGIIHEDETEPLVPPMPSSEHTESTMFEEYMAERKEKRAGVLEVLKTLHGGERVTVECIYDVVSGEISPLGSDVDSIFGISIKTDEGESKYIPISVIETISIKKEEPEKKKRNWLDKILGRNKE